MKIKKLLITVLILTFILAVPTTAATGQTASPLFDNTQSVILKLDFDGTNSLAITKITGLEGTTRIEATTTVYELVGNNWIILNQSTQIENSRFLTMGVNFTAEENSTYKMVAVVHVTNSEGITESFQRAKYANS